MDQNCLVYDDYSVVAIEAIVTQQGPFEIHFLIVILDKGLDAAHFAVGNNASVLNFRRTVTSDE